MRQRFITLVFASAVSLSQAADNPRASPVPSVDGVANAYKAFVMPDSGHFPMLEDPPRFNRSLDSVVKGFQQ